MFKTKEWGRRRRRRTEKNKNKAKTPWTEMGMLFTLVIKRLVFLIKQ